MRLLIHLIELGINFSHIQAKSLAVLNPLRRVDERIMDDADLAGPLLFVLCFGTFLLFVSAHPPCASVKVIDGSCNTFRP